MKNVSNEQWQVETVKTFTHIKPNLGKGIILFWGTNPYRFPRLEFPEAKEVCVESESNSNLYDFKECFFSTHP